MSDFLEGVELEEAVEEVTEMSEEMDTDVPVQEAEATTSGKDNRQWFDEEGNEMSRSAFIRHKFTEENISRKELSEKYEIDYRAVYQACQNMTNDAEPTGRGRAAAQHKIYVNLNGDVASEGKDGETLLNNEVVEADSVNLEEFEEVDRNTWVKEQVEMGESRGDIAKKLGLSYGVVYGITKEMSGTRKVHEIEYNGEVLSRSEYIRRRFAEGMTKSEIAKELGVDYSVVWSATKKEKSNEEKFEDALDKLAKLEDLVADDDKKDFLELIEQIKLINTKEEEEAEAEETEEVANEEPTEPTESVYADEE